MSNNDDAVAVATGQRRRSPVVKQRRQFTSRHRNTCDRAEKSKFNSNLIENFKIEYRRTNISNDGKFIFIIYYNNFKCLIYMMIKP